jgi:hypothetical protein
MNNSFEKASVERWQTGEVLHIETSAALYQPKDLEKVTGFAPYRNMDLEISRLSRFSLVVPPATFFSFKNVIHSEGNLYVNRTKHQIAGNTKKLLAKITQMINSEGTVVANRQSHQYYGHWLHDEFPMTAFFKQHGRVFTTHIGKKNTRTKMHTTTF